MIDLKKPIYLKTLFHQTIYDFIKIVFTMRQHMPNN